MNRLIKIISAFTIAALLGITMMGSSVFASDTVFNTDSSGNYFGAGQTVDISSLNVKKVENEFFAAGYDVTADEVDINGSAFMAGNNVSLTDAKVGGSAFLAGNSVKIDTVAKNNIWAVGASVSTSADTSVKGLHVAAGTVNCNGTFDSATLCGDTVTFNANVKGDVEIEAETVVLGENASVGGNLKIKAKSAPENASEIVKGTYTFEENKENNEDEGSEESGFSFGKVAGKAAGKATAGFIILKKIKKMVFNLFRFALMALIFAIVFKKNLESAYETATKKAGAHWGLGAVTVLFFPLAAIIICITIIGLPFAGLLTALYILALCNAWVFTFASLGRELIFTHTPKRLNPIAETVLAVLPAAIIKEIPVIGGLVGFACAIYTLGYVVLAIAKTISDNNEKKTEEV